MSNEKIKEHYVLEGEIDKFTKVADYGMFYPGLTLDADLITDHVKAESDSGIGSARGRRKTVRLCRDGSHRAEDIPDHAGVRAPGA